MARRCEASASVWRWQKIVRDLALRGGSLRSDRNCGWGGGRPGESYNIGGWNEKSRTFEIVQTICDLVV